MLEYISCAKSIIGMLISKSTFLCSFKVCSLGGDKSPLLGTGEGETFIFLYFSLIKKFAKLQEMETVSCPCYHEFVHNYSSGCFLFLNINLGNGFRGVWLGMSMRAVGCRNIAVVPQQSIYPSFYFQATFSIQGHGGRCEPCSKLK